MRPIAGYLILTLFLGQLAAPVLSAQEEASPIEVELIVPQQAGPGTIMEVQIKYNAVDLNAGAVLNYNVFGPAHVRERNPEPPNPIVNTWVPDRDTAQGTIKIQLQIHEGTEGQKIQHLVEVRWGPKVRTYKAETQVKIIPPTPTPTAPPRPRPVQPTLTLAPTPTVAAPAETSLELIEVYFVDSDRQPLDEAEANQELGIQARYTSSAELQNVTIEIRGEPEVINLEGLEFTEGKYVLSLVSLPAAPGGALLFDPPLKGRIRPYTDGGEGYALQTVVRVEPESGTADVEYQELASAPLRVSQELSLQVGARIDAGVIRAGGSFIVHAFCENPSDVPAHQVVLGLSDLPDGFVVSPDKQAIQEIAAGGGIEERLFTIRTPEGADGPVTFRVVATIGETSVESEAVTAQVSAPMPLRLEVSPSASTVYAGEAVYVDVSALNASQFGAPGVTARLIDVTGNLGVLVQEAGDIDAGESREWVFVVEIPADYPSDVEARLVVQTNSTDGVTSQSSEIPLSIVCRPVYQVLVEQPIGRFRGGQSLEVISLVSNVGPCLAREVSVSIEGLPETFTGPPEQQIVELVPGGSRYVTFQLMIPQGYQGVVRFSVRASDSLGAQSESLPAGLQVNGVSPLFTVIFGLLAVLAVAAIVVGIVLYLRHR
jgi:hypothetical protein